MQNRKNSYQNNKQQVEEILKQLVDNKLEIKDVVEKLSIRERTPNKPYFRRTRSRAIACYGVKREPIVLYRSQWLRLAKVFIGGKNCYFNKFFFNNEKKNIVEPVTPLPPTVDNVEENLIEDNTVEEI